MKNSNLNKFGAFANSKPPQNLPAPKSGIFYSWAELNEESGVQKCTDSACVDSFGSSFGCESIEKSTPGISDSFSMPRPAVFNFASTSPSVNSPNVNGSNSSTHFFALDLSVILFRSFLIYV